MALLQFMLLLGSSWCFASAAFYTLPPLLHQSALQNAHHRWQQQQREHFPSKAPAMKTAIQSVSDVESYNTVQSSGTSLVDELEDIKRDIVSLCVSNDDDKKPSLQVIGDKVRRLEEVAEQVGVGQASSTSGLLNGEW